MKTILIVEDSEFNIDLLTQILEQEYALLTARDGAEGVRLVEQYRPDLVLMDISLPVMDGYEATRAIRRTFPALPVIGLSAHAMQGDAEQARAAGCTDYLTKPVDETLLLKKLKEHLDQDSTNRNSLVAGSRKPVPLGAAETNLAPSMPHPRILIVDDEEFNVDYLAQELESLQYETSSANNGQEALERVTACPPDLILLDIMMPGLDGFEVLARLKANPAARDIPVIIISATSDLQSVVHGIQLGAEDYLPKPFETTLLRARISSSLEKKRLLDLQHLYLKSLEREMEIGREIQKGFLPARLPEVDGWEIATYFQSAKEVAGDFYDAFELSAIHRICLVIADVCDKGVGAALFMTLFRSLLRFTIAATDIFGEHSPEERLNFAATLTNNYIATTHGDTGMFATAFFGLLDPHSGRLDYVNAGHEIPLVLHENAESTRLLRTGPALGVLTDAKFGVREVHLQAGDLLFAFTDGAPDAHNIAGQSLGKENLFSLLHLEMAAAALLEEIGRRIDEHMRQASQFDDITLLALRRLPDGNAIPSEIQLAGSSVRNH